MAAAFTDRPSPAARSSGHPWLARPWRVLAFDSEGALVPEDSGFPVDVLVHAAVAGTITAPDAGNLCGWADLAAVLAAIGSGATYVNVHTNDGVAPPNTGPGDFPGGEIRGQVR